MRFASFYSGAGGMDLGFVAAGFVPVFANDIDADATATYTEAMRMCGFSEPHVATGDIREVNGVPGFWDADVVIGGPPCQGFSVAGKMDPNDPRSRHVFDFLAMVERVQPKAFVMENVKALAQNKRWSGTIADIRAKAESMGYKTHLKVLNSADYGVPQTRERMFLVGVKGGVARYSFPEPSVERHVTAGEALRSMPRYGFPGNDQVCSAKVVPLKRPILRGTAYAGMLFNGQGRPIDFERPCNTLPATMGGNRTPIVDQESLETGCRQWVEGYREHLLAGGDVASSAPERLRRLTVQEAAELQSFPRNMPWNGSQCSRFRQIGNAVPPKMAFAVAVSVAASLGNGGPIRYGILLELSN